MSSLRCPRDSSISSASILVHQVTSWNFRVLSFPQPIQAISRPQAHASSSAGASSPSSQLAAVYFLFIPGLPLGAPPCTFVPSFPLSLPSLPRVVMPLPQPEGGRTPSPLWLHAQHGHTVGSISRVPQHQHGQPQAPFQLSPGFHVQGTRTLGFWTTLLT